MTVELCPSCGRPIRPPPRRYAVALSPIKTSIVDLVRRAGDAGISRAEIMRAVYVDRPMPSIHAVKVHICQINKAWGGTGYAIVSEHRRWFLRKVEQAA